MGDGFCCAVLCGCVGGAGVLLAVLGLYCAVVIMFFSVAKLWSLWCWCFSVAGAAMLLVLVLW